ncbi:T9SS type A sorting domain-containing protein [Flavobacterium sp. UMI-01]|uniref:T9SS type A sorting domain-containing protein n=1 Tax=Flavobacterium sp. UMI-01 TaxID=1441053 RepID=UPI001C7DDDFA|nr:T9SS type A sorting domain-containing protein [Flavobacterium sp. UMI-01]GIZ08084.1 hypothetical protein FUMI01_08110 [Flavobacterium sp. UMI-01]
MIKSLVFGIFFLATLSYGQERILLNENFNDNGNAWDLRPTAKEFIVNIDKGVLHLEKLHKNFDNRGCLWYSKEIDSLDTSKNFSIVVDAKQISGGDFKDVLDIQWGVSSKRYIKEKAMLYQLDIHLDGFVWLKFYQSKWDYFNKVNIKRKLEEIGFDPKAKNRYEVLQEEGFVRLKINGQEVYKQYILPIDGNCIGFQHCLKGAWEIDQIIVSQLLPIKNSNIEKETIIVDSQTLIAENDTITDTTDKLVNNISVISKPIADQGLQVFKKEELVIYPNPFKEAFNVQFNLDEDGFVNLYLFNISGQLMKTETKNFQKGDVTFMLEAVVPTGVYIVRVVTKNNSNLYKKIIRVAD